MHLQRIKCQENCEINELIWFILISIFVAIQVLNRFLKFYLYLMYYVKSFPCQLEKLFNVLVFSLFYNSFGIFFSKNYFFLIVYLLKQLSVVQKISLLHEQVMRKKFLENFQICIALLPKPTSHQKINLFLGSKVIY